MKANEILHADTVVTLYGGPLNGQERGTAKSLSLEGELFSFSMPLGHVFRYAVYRLEQGRLNYVRMSTSKTGAKNA